MLLSRLPLGNSPEGEASFDLHALSAPPAFVLSQDQTLRSTDVASLRYSTVQGATAKGICFKRYTQLYTSRHVRIDHIITFVSPAARLVQ